MQVKLTGRAWPAWLRGRSLEAVHKRDNWYTTRGNGGRDDGWNVELGSDRSGYGGVSVSEDTPPKKPKVDSPAKIIAIKEAIGRGLEDDTDPSEILHTILDILDS